MKYKWVAVLLVVATAGGGLIWGLSRSEPEALPTKTLQAQAVNYTACYTGRVESAESRSVYTDTACVAGEVLVKTGQMVEKGDVLFTVDADATGQVAATLSGLGGMSEIAVPEATEMVAPVRGIVSVLNVKAGELTKADKPCVVISSGEELQVKLSVPERALPRLFEGQAVSVSGVAFDKEAYKGTVTEIASAARTQLTAAGSDTVVDVTVTLDPEEIDPSLRIGLSADADILLEEIDSALVVPFEAVMQEDNGREYVFVVERATAKKVYITSDRATADGVVVTKGLTPGCRVITAPERVTEDGMAVRE